MWIKHSYGFGMISKLLCDIYMLIFHKMKKNKHEFDLMQH